jgi:hypothetical protein
MAVVAVGCENTNPSGSSTNPTPATAAPQTAPNTQTPPSTVTNTNATVQRDPLAVAENRDQVRQYPDQHRLTPAIPAKMITGFSAEAREAPTGSSIATIESSENVTEVARDAKGNYYLVLYPDAKNPGKELAGWVYRDAIENVAWSQTRPENGKALSAMTGTKVDCARGQSHVRTDRDFCAKVCKDDKGCDKDKGEVCDGLAFELKEKAGKMEKAGNARYCVAISSPSTSTSNIPHAEEHGKTPMDMK